MVACHVTAADVYLRGQRFLCATMIMRRRRLWSVDLHCRMISKIYGHIHRTLRDSDLGMRMLLFFREGYGYRLDTMQYTRLCSVTLNYSGLFDGGYLFRVPFYCGFL